MLETVNPRERIRREAMRLFVTHGVDAVSMRDIADAVGLKAPSLYAHFRSREALIGDLFFASYTEYGRQLAAAAAAEGGFRRQLEAMVRVIWSQRERSGCGASLMPKAASTSSSNPSA